MDMYDGLISNPFTRRALLKGAGAAGVGMVLAPVAQALPVNAQSGGDLQDILNITCTTEEFGITFLTAGINNAKAGKFNQPVPDLVVAILEAARAQEQFHLDYFRSLGGRALTDTFTIPDPKLVTDVPSFFGAVAGQEEREIAAQLAAMKTFTELGRIDIVKGSFQYASEEAEHRVLANYVAGARPANDRAFEPLLYNSIQDFLAQMKQLGFIGGSGTLATYPGPSVINATNVIERTPGGPMVNCTAAAATSAAPVPVAPAAGGQIPTQMPATGSGYSAATEGGLFGLLGAVGLGTAVMAALVELRERGRTEADDSLH